VSSQKVSFRHLGARGSFLLNARLYEGHILAITVRRSASTCQEGGVDGPLFLAKDTHALSEPAFATALEVLAGNEVDVMADRAWVSRRPGALARHPYLQSGPSNRAGRMAS